jgi:excisionase family DNA binding protein
MKSPLDGPIDGDTLLSSNDVAGLLHVNATTINNWVDARKILASRTVGGHRRIRVSDLLEFLARQQMPAPAQLAGAMQRRLLFVDDDRAHLRAVGRQLKPHAARVLLTLVDNGVDALVTVGSFRPHLIVIDVLMPEVDGLEVCRRLKANPATASIDVVLVSSAATPEMDRAARKAGAIGCLKKPLAIRALLELARVPMLGPR